MTVQFRYKTLFSKPNLKFNITRGQALCVIVNNIASMQNNKDTQRKESLLSGTVLSLIIEYIDGLEHILCQYSRLLIALHCQVNVLNNLEFSSKYGYNASKKFKISCHSRSESTKAR